MDPLDPPDAAQTAPNDSHPPPPAPSAPPASGGAAAEHGGLLGTLDAIGRVLRGKGPTLRAALTCAVAGGHLLLEDVPGTGKTTLARALAAALGLSFQRIQMTSDLLPQDLTGASYPDLSAPPSALGSEPPAGPAQGRFVPGPIFTEFLLADELNRTPPRTQSALLEAMAERSVTVDGSSHGLPSPFIVVATQNPIEFAGTFPLPESQLDRFMMRLAPGYPDRAAERTMLEDRRSQNPLIELEANREEALSRRAALLAAMKAVDHVAVADPVVDYLLDIMDATRTKGNDSPFLLGASPRAAVDLDRACRARAALDGRGFVIPEDVQALATCVLAHRLVPQPHAALDTGAPARLLEAIISDIPPPRLSPSGDFVR